MASHPEPGQTARALLTLAGLGALGLIVGTYVGAALIAGALGGVALLGWWQLRT